MEESSNKRPRSSSPPVPSTRAKVMKQMPQENASKAESPEATNVVFHSAEQFSNQVRTAFDIKHALQKQHRINAIGRSLTTYEEDDPPNAKQQRILKDLRDVYKVSPEPYKAGQFDDEFYLKITQPSCEFDGTSKELSEEHLKTWFKNAPISGYGDNKSLETKTDLTVRDAREISCDAFSVQPEFLEKINSTWQEEFFYPANVRVEPYKIHIYGPHGHFKSHRDTPEPGLIGTFLLGIGETKSWAHRGGFFHVGDERFRAEIGKWVSFYPDVPHHISVLPEDYYRAVIAFKIFSISEAFSMININLELQKRIEKILHAIPRPFGILLDHLYHLGAVELNGYDTILLAGAQTCQDSIVHILPVIISTDAEWYYEDEYDRERIRELYEEDERRSSYDAEVKPFLPAHVDILNGRSTLEAQQAVQFLEGVMNVPFYCCDFKRSADLWQEKTSEINYTGNDADGKRESSIYLSHALLVLPTGKDEIGSDTETSSIESYLD